MTFEEIIKRHGLTLTKARQEIFNLLKTADRPMSVNEIISQSPVIDRATVYRTIKLFDELQITKHVWFGTSNRIELSEEFVAHHHHIVSKNCGRIEKIDSTLIEKTIARAALKADYKLSDHHIELIGLCQDCRKSA